MSEAMNSQAQSAEAESVIHPDLTLDDVAVQVDDLDLWYDTNQALKNVSLDIAEKKVTAFIGPSGCGKSTLLRCFNRLNDLIDICRVEGEIKLHGQNLLGPDVDVAELRRRVGMVFQKPNPFPKSIYENVAFGPLMAGKDRAEAGSIANTFLQLVGLKKFGGRYPAELSGGMQQRASIARALAFQADILLMDEPFGALDAQTRTILSDELQRIWLETRPTVVFVTHNLIEAAFLSDTVHLLSSGPGRIVRTYDIDIPRPRDEADPALLDLRHDMLERLRAEVDDAAERRAQVAEVVAL